MIAIPSSSWWSRIQSSKAANLTQAYHRYTLNYINALNYLEGLRRQVEFNEFEKVRSSPFNTPFAACLPACCSHISCGTKSSDRCCQFVSPCITAIKTNPMISYLNPLQQLTKFRGFQAISHFHVVAWMNCMHDHFSRKTRCIFRPINSRDDSFTPFGNKVQEALPSIQQNVRLFVERWDHFPIYISEIRACMAKIKSYFASDL